MARLPGLDDLKKIDSVLSDIAGKLDRMSSSNIDRLFAANVGPLDDISSALDDIMAVSERWGKHLKKVYEKGKDLAKQQDLEIKRIRHIQKEREKIYDLQKKLGALEKKEADQLEDLNGELKEHYKELDKIGIQIDGMDGKWTTMAKLIGGSVLTAINKAGKAIFDLGIGMTVGFLESLEKGVMRVYELFERWTKAMGALNMRIGSTSKNMGHVTREAKRWEGTIRGLTDQFGEGLEMFQEFNEGFERTQLAGKDATAQYEKFSQVSLMAGRGLGIGAEQAGEFSKSMYQLGESAQEVTTNYADMIANARAAGVSTNKFAREIVSSKNFMVSFGKSGQKTIGIAMAFAKSMGVSAKSLEQFTRTTDSFEGAATAAAKLNTVFGTSIDSLQLMMEDDPSKRIEMIRKQLQAQGRDFEHMSRRERNLISETMGITEEEVAGVLSSGQTLEEFQKKQAKEKENQKNDEKALRKAMMDTAQTMYAFGQQIDRITMRIAKVLRPFTDMIGLTEKGKEGFSGLGALANKVFDGIDNFLTKVSKNKSFNKLLTDLGVIIKQRFDQVMEWAQSDDLQGWVTSISKGVKGWITDINRAIDVFTSLFKVVEPILKWITENSSTISEIWAGLSVAIEAFVAGKSLITIGQGISSITGAAGGAAAGIGGIVAAVGQLAAAFGVGYAAGTLLDKLITKMIGDGRTLGQGLYDLINGEDERKMIKKAERLQMEKTHDVIAKQNRADYMSSDAGKHATAATIGAPDSAATITAPKSAVSAAASSPVSTAAASTPVVTQPNLAKKKSTVPAKDQGTGVYLDGTQVGKVIGPIIGHMMVKDANSMPGMQ